MTTRDLSGKRAVIFGAASGIGRSTAQLFVEAGARVLLADVAAGALAAVERELGELGEVRARAADVRDDSAVISVVHDAVEAWDGIDCAVNLAAVEGNELVPMADASDANFDLVLGVNLKGIWNCMRAELAVMQATGGSIVNVSSVAALAAFPGLAAYSASKAGILALTRTAAAEYGSNGVRVNAVCPGSVDTPMRDRSAHLRSTPADGPDRAYAKPPTRTADPREIAEAVLWLSSDAASFCTAHTMVVDGGFTGR